MFTCLTAYNGVIIVLGLGCTAAEDEKKYKEENGHAYTINTKIHRENPLVRHILYSMPRCCRVKVVTADYRLRTKRIQILTLH